MNNKFLVLISFLIALLCHLFVFNSCTVIFPIDPVTPKPKLFFLGPTLKQGEINQVASKKPSPQTQMTSGRTDSTENDPTHIQYETTDPEKNPFLIQAIKKPLIPQTASSEKKVILKSIFETSSEGESSEIPESQHSDQELEIRPYRPLQFRVP